jgi:hypothetical protein
LQILYLEQALIADCNRRHPSFAKRRALEIDFGAIDLELAPRGASVNRIAIFVQTFVAIQLAVDGVI